MRFITDERYILFFYYTYLHHPQSIIAGDIHTTLHWHIIKLQYKTKEKQDVQFNTGKSLFPFKFRICESLM